MTASNHDWEVMSSKFIQADMNYEVIVVKWSAHKQKGKVSDRTKIIRLPYRPNQGQLLTLPNLF